MNAGSKTVVLFEIITSGTSSDFTAILFETFPEAVVLKYIINPSEVPLVNLSKVHLCLPDTTE